MLILLKIFERSNAPTVEIKVPSISVLEKTNHRSGR
jgi:hypothetical protein